MNEWGNLLNDFLKLAQYPILKHKGKVLALEAMNTADFFDCLDLGITGNGRVYSGDGIR
jgi:hypothetical protein